MYVYYTFNITEKKMERCLECNEELSGREGKKFCTPYCKSAWHYKNEKTKEKKLFIKIDKQLKTNRRLLKLYNKAGKSTVRKQELIDAGFNPKYFTHYWKAKNNNLYLFCYEYGFMEIDENSNKKYVLVLWQPYMS